MSAEISIEELLYFHQQHAAHYRERALKAEAILRELKAEK